MSCSFLFIVFTLSSIPLYIYTVQYFSFLVFSLSNPFPLPVITMYSLFSFFFHCFFYLFPVIIVYQSSSFLFPSPWRLVVLFMTSSVRCPLIFPFLRPFLVPSPFIIHSKSSIHPYHHHLPFPTIKILYPPLFHIHVLSLSSYFPFLAHTTVQYIPV